jgi:hypothetical protein
MKVAMIRGVPHWSVLIKNWPYLPRHFLSLKEKWSFVFLGGTGAPKAEQTWEDFMGIHWM